ncbi:hypothetical protein PFICI_12410 [Pestalotiopsis fici W106-1]|uniref:Uncharacterized protein n=1 Tax=Pestalotiopsis fici (strain W106-1 / CGMCC3.15140) TaxID=1229662 RepID=W3WRL7_PESFW|nr:uncharacterized protein PFICI_12410 [Pestalotiopsis fici W106-1]ETS75466.1 hypothetical protein PFICI_12410 [Pestalotiopsis fici W106-1]
MSAKLESEAAYEATWIRMLQRQFTRPKPLPADTNLEGQTAIVTGSNGGLGLEACRQLLKLGLSRLVLGVRSQAKGEAAANGLRQTFDKADISVWIVDHESYDSIREFVGKCETLPRLDIAILNAAVITTSYTTVPSTGHENILQVNYLSTALLAILLLPILKSKKVPDAVRPPVLNLVGTDLMYQPEFVPRLTGPVLAQYDSAENFRFFPWYSGSKILLMCFVSRLARCVDANDVLINVSNPGLVKNTDLARNGSIMVRTVMGIYQFFLGKSVESGASVYLEAALGQGPDSHGGFVSEWTIRPYPAVWYTTEGKEFTERLWEETMEELNFAGASKIIKDMKGSAD